MNAKKKLTIPLVVAFLLILVMNGFPILQLLRRNRFLPELLLRTGILTPLLLQRTRTSMSRIVFHLLFLR